MNDQVITAGTDVIATKDMTFPWPKPESATMVHIPKGRVFRVLKMLPLNVMKITVDGVTVYIKPKNFKVSE